VTCVASEGAGVEYTVGAFAENASYPPKISTAVEVHLAGPRGRGREKPASLNFNGAT